MPSSVVEDPDRHPADFPRWHVWALITAAVTIKALFISVRMPSMWIWSDELFYFITAYDLVHWGEEWVPHRGFLFYPPLTSILILPVHLLGLDTPLRYPAALILLSIAQAMGALAMFRLVDEVFGIRSRLLLLFLLIGPPSYFSWALMSETLFIVFFGWLLYFFVRMEKTGRARDGLWVGIFFTAMVLTRKTGIFVAAGLAASLATAWLWRHRAGLSSGASVRSILLRYSAALGSAVAAGLAWRWFRLGVLDVEYGYRTIGGYVETGLLPALSSVDTILVLGRKLTANFLYVSLATYGVGVPLLLGYLVSRPRERSRSDALIDRLLVLVGCFMACCAGAAAVHMFIQRFNGNPRYHMYGRYMEYFSPIVIALCFGLIASRFRWRRRGAAVAVAVVLFSSALTLLALPGSFYPLTLSKTTLAPNYMGLGWLFGLGVASRPQAAIALLGVGLLGVAAVVAWSRWPRSRAVVAGCAVLFFGLATMNLVEVTLRASRKSFVSNETYGTFSRFIREHEEVFAGGLFIDSSLPDGDKSKRSDRIQWRKLCADYPHLCRVGRDAAPYVGQVPVLSRHALEYEVLYAPEDTAYRLYGVTRTTDTASTGARLSGREAGPAGRSETAVDVDGRRSPGR